MFRRGCKKMNCNRILAHIVSLSVMIILGFSQSTFTVLAENGTEIGSTDTFKYAYNDVGAVISEYLKTDPIVTIPAEIDGHAVIGLGTGLFKNNTSVTSVTIEANISEIPAECFRGASNLASVTAQWSGFTVVDNYAFYDTAITAFEIPENLATIGKEAFRKCSQLATITIASGRSDEKRIALGEYAFAECAALNSVDIPSIESSGGYLFSECTSLTAVNIGNNTGYMICRAKAPDFARSSYRQGDFTLKSGITNPITA